MAKDLYSLLNLKPSATDTEIKKNYRKLAFQCHPDKNKSDKAQEQFRDISEAYQILSNPQRRKRYDQFGYDTVNDTVAPIDPMELFSKILNVDFGQQMNQNVFFFSDLSPFGALQEVPANSLLHTLSLTLEELYSGTQKEFQVDAKDSHGSFKATKYVLNIKAGSKGKEHLVVNSGGHFNPLKGSHDDLVVQIKEIPHTVYTRQGDDLLKQCSISLSDALCGTDMTFTHFGQPLKVQVSDIIKPNSIYQVWEKGMPIKTSGSLGDGSTPSSSHGNLLLDLSIVFPEFLSDQNKDYIRKILDGDNEPNEEDETPEEPCMVLQAYYYKDKDDVIKELLNEDTTNDACALQ